MVSGLGTARNKRDVHSVNQPRGNENQNFYRASTPGISWQSCFALKAYAADSA